MEREGRVAVDAEGHVELAVGQEAGPAEVAPTVRRMRDVSRDDDLAVGLDRHSPEILDGSGRKARPGGNSVLVESERLVAALVGGALGPYANHDRGVRREEIRTADGVGENAAVRKERHVSRLVIEAGVVGSAPIQAAGRNGPAPPPAAGEPRLTPGRGRSPQG